MCSVWRMGSSDLACELQTSSMVPFWLHWYTDLSLIFFLFTQRTYLCLQLSLPVYFLIWIIIYFLCFGIKSKILKVRLWQKKKIAVTFSWAGFGGGGVQLIIFGTHLFRTILVIVSIFEECWSFCMISWMEKITL